MYKPSFLDLFIAADFFYCNFVTFHTTHDWKLPSKATISFHKKFKKSQNSDTSLVTFFLQGSGHFIIKAVFFHALFFLCFFPKFRCYTILIVVWLWPINIAKVNKKNKKVNRTTKSQQQKCLPGKHEIFFQSFEKSRRKLARAKKQQLGCDVTHVWWW